MITLRTAGARWQAITASFLATAAQDQQTKQVTGLGFKPRFVIIKRTDVLENWQIVDSERGSTKAYIQI